MNNKKHIIFIILVVIFSNGFAQQKIDVLHFNDEKAILLKWNIHKTADGYNVYRKENNGAWQKINQQPISYLTHNSKIIDALGIQSKLLLGLMGKANENDNLSINDYKSTWQNKDQFNFISAMAFVHPQLNKALGITFTDKQTKEGSTYQYQIKAITNNNEIEWASTDIIQKQGKEIVPTQDLIEGQGMDNAAHIYWTKHKNSIDNGDVITYNVYRSENELGGFMKVNYQNIFPMQVVDDNGKFHPYQQDYLDEFLDNEKPYFFYIKAVNAFGFESDASITIKIIPGNYDPPLPPYNLKVERLGGAALLQWENDESSIKGYEIYRSETNGATPRKIFPASNAVLSNSLEYLDDKIEAGKTYFYSIKSVNQALLLSDFSEKIELYFDDLIPPTPPTNFEGNNSALGEIKLVWKAPAGNDIRGYRIERTGGMNQLNRMYQLIHAEMVLDTVFIDTDFEEASEGEFAYLVYAIDNAGNESYASDTLVIRLKDKIPPASPYIIDFDEDEANHTFTIKWSPANENDFANYNVYFSTEDKNYSKVATINDASQYDYAYSAYGDYFFKVSITDLDGNESELSDFVSATLKATAFPSAPLNGKVKYIDKKVQLNWAASSDKKVIGYLISKYANGGDVRTDIGAVKKGNEFVFQDEYVIEGDRYLYEIRAYDKDWNLSIPLSLEIKVDE